MVVHEIIIYIIQIHFWILSKLNKLHNFLIKLIANKNVLQNASENSKYYGEAILFGENERKLRPFKLVFLSIYAKIDL